MKAFAEISENGRAIDVHFRYSPEAVAAIKWQPEINSGIPGARFVPKDKGGPLWRIPLDLESGKRLREVFGAGLSLGNALKAWGRDEVQKQRNLRSLANADDAKLNHLPKVHPDLAKFIGSRPYQRADIAMMAQANVLNANQPGTGKTIEVLGSWIESKKWDEGPHLVIAPVRSLENVWAIEAEWTGLDVYTAEDPTERRRVVAEGMSRAMDGEPVVICVNPDMIRLKKIWDQKKDADKPPPKTWAMKDVKGNIYDFANDLNRQLLTLGWKTATIDEFHKMGLSNRWSLLSMGMSMVDAELKAALSGTPMGGRPRKLWAILNWLEPQEYTSEWRWIGQWLEVDDNGYGKTVGGIQPGREDEFYTAHARHLVRRLKRDALPGLPPKVEIIVKCKMSPAQKKQYREFEKNAEIRIEEERLSATNVLAEYTRLKQFANAKQELRSGDPWPTTDSGKLDQLMEKLDEEGIRKDEPEPGARAIVGSYSSRMAVTVYEYLLKAGIDCGLITGDTKDTKSIIKRFKDGQDRPYVIVMTIQTGGVSLNLEEAGSMHALDESWNPDDEEQFFDRGDRGSRETPLKCYIYRTKGTIQEYIAEVSAGKKVTNRNVLDLRRELKTA